MRSQQERCPNAATPADNTEDVHGFPPKAKPRIARTTPPRFLTWLLQRRFRCDIARALPSKHREITDLRKAVVDDCIAAKVQPLVDERTPRALALVLIT